MIYIYIITLFFLIYPLILFKKRYKYILTSRLISLKIMRFSYKKT